MRSGLAYFSEDCGWRILETPWARSHGVTRLAGGCTGAAEALRKASEPIYQVRDFPEGENLSWNLEDGLEFF